MNQQNLLKMMLARLVLGENNKVHSLYPSMKRRIMFVAALAVVLVATVVVVVAGNNRRLEIMNHHDANPSSYPRVWHNAAVKAATARPPPSPNKSQKGPVVDLKSAPMGFMSWERFRCEIDCEAHPNECINEKLYMTIADALVDGGYAAAGYTRVHIDDCWASMQRDVTTQQLQPHPQRFPSGMRALADYMHDRGLLLGLYGDVGTHTCGGYPGSQGYEVVDAQTLAEWGADYLKLDGCYMEQSDYSKYYRKWGAALRQVAAQQEIVFSCSWPAYLGDDETQKPFEEMYYEAGCNTWRNWADIDNSWPSLKGIIQHWAKYADVLVHKLPTGAYHDADMLLVGDDHYGQVVLSTNQARVQMGFWALISSPLLIGGDVRTIPEEYQRILLNSEIIAINQDAGRHMAVCYSGCPSGSYDDMTPPDELQVWVKTLQGGRSVTMGFFNLNEKITGSFQIGYVFGKGTRIAKCLDLWAPGGTLVNLCPENTETTTTTSAADTKNAPPKNFQWNITRQYLDNGSLEIIVRAKNVAPTSHQMLRLDLVEQD